MKPGVDVYLDELKRALAQDFVPKLATAFEQGTLTRHAVLVGIAAEEFDRAASRRIEENQALRALFAGAVAATADSELRARLRAAAAGEDRSFRVSDLDRGNNALRALLIELHAHVEQLAGENARALEAAIWRELARSTERRRTSFNRF